MKKEYDPTIDNPIHPLRLLHDAMQARRFAIGGALLCFFGAWMFAFNEGVHANRTLESCYFIALTFNIGGLVACYFATGTRWISTRGDDNGAAQWLKNNYRYMRQTSTLSDLLTTFKNWLYWERANRRCAEIAQTRVRRHLEEIWAEFLLQVDNLRRSDFSYLLPP